MMWKVTTLILWSLIVAEVRAIPGKPGKEWTPQEVKIIQEKLKRLWDTPTGSGDPIKILDDFDLVEENAEFKDFVYDPTI